jgi:hypothetical protein
VITPVHRLVDLGYEAVPQLIEALDDRRFTRCLVESFKATSAPVAMRVGDLAKKILEHLSGRNFFARRADDGSLVNGSTRQQAESWWAEVHAKGEKKLLIEAAAAGGQEGCTAARKLVEKYPDVALAAIDAGFRATPNDGTRSEFVELAGELPGEAPLAFLRSKLTPNNGVYSQVQAARALFARGKPEAVPAMIAAWAGIQKRLSTDEGDSYYEAGRLITFLAKSGQAEAIQALIQRMRTAPVEVRLAIVRAFAPWPKSAGMSASGKSVHVEADIAELPAGPAGVAIERLLLAALDDREKRLMMTGHYDEATYEDPRVCDMAAFILSKRWPQKYRFHWARNASECDAQIASMRGR